MNRSPETSVPATQSVKVEKKVPNVALTDAHYERIKERIRREIKGTLTTSFWITLALTAAALGGSFVITVNSVRLGEATCGQFELAYWICFAFALFCVAMHLVYHRGADKRADDVIDELEANIFRMPGSKT